VQIFFCYRASSAIPKRIVLYLLNNTYSMRGLEDPFNYAVIDPGSWKDSIKTPIYTLLDGLREAVHGYSATERHLETEELLKNGAEAVVKILEDAVKQFKVREPLDWISRLLIRIRCFNSQGECRR
jgi:hypothetical protein